MSAGYRSVRNPAVAYLDVDLSTRHTGWVRVTSNRGSTYIVRVDNLEPSPAGPALTPSAGADPTPPYLVERYGHAWIAHRPSTPGHDCTDDATHGTGEHPVTAIRALLKLEEGR